MRRAVVALGVPRTDRLDLAQEPGSAALDKRHVRSDAHPIYVAARREIVERAQHHVKLAVVRHAKLGRLDIAVVRDDLHLGVERACTRLGDLRLGLLDMLLLEEELAIQVRQVDRVEVDLGEPRDVQSQCGRHRAKQGL